MDIAYADGEMLFDGKLRIHSTCMDCGEIMLVTRSEYTVHPTCTMQLTKLQQLTANWAEAIAGKDFGLADQILLRIEKLEMVIDLASAAHEYAEWGWPVFPLARNSKMPAISKAKGGNGFKDATSDTARIARWWGKHPDHNIGLATGHIFDCIDIDPKNGGVQSFLKLLADKDLPDTHAIAVTASGGMHLYVKPTGKGNFANLRQGIDYRGKGGYVVAPPSTLGERWRSYTWLTVPSPTLKENA